MAEAKEKPKKPKAGIALVLGEPEEESPGAVAKDAAVQDLLEAIKSDDAEGVKSALSSFVEACTGEYE